MNPPKAFYSEPKKQTLHKQNLTHHICDSLVFILFARTYLLVCVSVTLLCVMFSDRRLVALCCNAVLIGPFLQQ